MQSIVPLIRYHIRKVAYKMAGRCDVCKRKPMHGNNVSFSQRRTRRSFVVNVQRRHMNVDGTKRTINICTRCMRTIDKLPDVPLAKLPRVK